MRLRPWLTAALLFLAPCSLWAVIGTIDVTPAATLLFPYFEVELAEPNGVGRTTVITIQSATPTAAVAHVTLWTDLGIPTYAFDIYLTGYDTQAMNLRDILEGRLPRTADDGVDVSDMISNQGQYSQDINWPGSTGPCATQDYTIPANTLADIRAAHTGNLIPSSARYAGTSRGDQVARGYITVDVVTQCTLLLPNQAGYFSGVAGNWNTLLGEYLFVDPGENFMQAEKAVHIEASPALAGQRTFYGRLASAAGGIDNREPLPSTWVFGALTDPVVAGRTELIVWRDPGIEVVPFASQPPAVPFPMTMVEARAFDDESRPTSLALTLAPYATNRNRVMDTVTSKLGWARLNLNVGPAAADVRQSWVAAIRTWEGRFSTGNNGVQLDPDIPRLDLIDITSPEAVITGTATGFRVAIPQGVTVHLNYHLRLQDTANRTLCGSITGAGLTTNRWAADPLESEKCITVSPGTIHTNDLWISHDLRANSAGSYLVQVGFRISGGSYAQSISRYFSIVTTP